MCLNISEGLAQFQFYSFQIISCQEHKTSLYTWCFAWEMSLVWRYVVVDQENGRLDLSKAFAKQEQFSTSYGSKWEAAMDL